MVVDEGKVIKDLILLLDKTNDYVCEGLKCCDVADEALNMIREQRKQIGVLNMRNNPLSPCNGAYEAGHEVVKCEVCCLCKSPVSKSWKYCPICGQAVKWE